MANKPILNNKSRLNKKRAMLSSLVVAVIGTVILYRSFAAVSTEPPQGLMIQVSSLAPSTSPATLKTWLEKIRTKHRSSSSTAYINNIVLQNIADSNGNLLANYLDVIAPYLPGGATPAFTRAYIGTVDLSWTGAGSKYIEGIENAEFRNQNVSLSNAVAKKFVTRYPRASINWYITYEANMAGFWDANIQGAYTVYINQLMTSLSSVKSGKTFMWSPAFWTPRRSQPAWAMPSLQANFTSMFSNIKQPFILNMQDFVGQSNGVSTKEDAVDWVKYLKQNSSSSNISFQINTEQFKQASNGTISVGDPIEIPARENYYKSQGIQLGSSWEIRYWYKRLYPI